MSARAAAAEQTHERILDAARERFLAAPYDEVTLAGIATDAGVSTQTVLNRFATKENLFLEFVARFHDESPPSAPAPAAATSARPYAQCYASTS